MLIAIKLITAHLIGDFILQPKKWVNDKAQKKAKSIYLYYHIGIHGILYQLFLWEWKYWYITLLLIALHFLIDLMKLTCQKSSTQAPWFFIDQLLHLGSIILVTQLVSKINIDWKSILNNPTLWIYLSGIIFVSFAAGIIINLLLSKWAQQLQQENSDALINAGKYIGILERLLVFIFICIGHWEAVGFLITAKSVFRFSDIKQSKQRQLTEYILIGTLLSFGIAITTTLLVKALTHT